jgi:hypothetical protein
MVTAVYVLRWNTCIVALINHRIGKIILLIQELRFVAWSCNKSQAGEERISKSVWEPVQAGRTIWDNKIANCVRLLSLVNLNIRAKQTHRYTDNAAITSVMTPRSTTFKHQNPLLDTILRVRFHVLTAASMEMAVFWVVAPSDVSEVLAASIVRPMHHWNVGKLLPDYTKFW